MGGPVLDLLSVLGIQRSVPWARNSMMAKGHNIAIVGGVLISLLVLECCETTALPKYRNRGTPREAKEAETNEFDRT